MTNDSQRVRHADRIVSIQRMLQGRIPNEERVLIESEQRDLWDLHFEGLSFDDIASISYDGWRPRIAPSRLDQTPLSSALRGPRVSEGHSASSLVL